MQVILTEQEMRVAADAGITRRIVSMRQGLKGAAGYDGGAGGHWQIDVLGAMGELAVAKSLGVYWTPTVNTFKLPDVGADIHVRTTEHRDGRLLIRANDVPGWYVLVIADAPKFNVAGCCSLEFAKVEEFKTTLVQGRPPVWAVPQSRLAPIEWLAPKDSQHEEAKTETNAIRVSQTADLSAGQRR